MKGVESMVTYYIRKNVLGSNCRSIIKDESNRDSFLMVGRWGARGDVFSLYQLDGTLIASIKQATFALALGTRFDLYYDGDKVGTLQRLLTLNRDFYYVRKLNWAVMGSIDTQTYSIYHFNHQIMTIEPVRKNDRTELRMTVCSEADAPICLCIAAVLDYWSLKTDSTPSPLSNLKKGTIPPLPTE